MEKNREDVEHFVYILKRDEEIEQVSLGGGRRSTASSAVSKLSEAEHHHEKSVHYDAYSSPQVVEGEQHHQHGHEHQNSDDSFDKVENHHVQEKSIHYEAYSSEVHSDEQHHQQEHSDDSSDKNLTIIRREVQYDPYSSEIVENDDDPHHHHDQHQRESSNDSGEEKENISVVEKVVHHDDHHHQHQHQYSDDSSEKENFHVVEKMVHYDPYSSEVLVDKPPHRSSSSDESVGVHEKHQQSHDGYELPRSKQPPQHYSTIERTPTDINRYDNPPASEERYIHNIQVGQSFKSAKVENDDYLILKARDATVTQNPAPAAPKQVQEVHHQKAVEQAASSPKSKKEKNPYMAFDMSSDAANPLIEKSYDLDDRDTHDNVQYLNTNFFEIFAEPSPQYHSVACVWTLSFKIFEIVRVYSYKILTLIFGLLIAVLAGFFFALFAFLNIWIVRPLLYLARVALSQIITIWPMALIYIVRPFFYSVGAVFSTARLHTSSGSQVPEIWEKHVHVV